MLPATRQTNSARTFADEPVSAGRRRRAHNGARGWGGLQGTAGRTWEFEADLVALLPTLRARAAFLERGGNTAGDLVQDTVERALSNWFGFRPGTSMRRWLLVIMQNLFVDRCRQRKRVRESVAREFVAAETPDAVEDQNADLARVPHAMALVGRLTAPLRETVRLVLLDGRSYREAAAQLGVPTPTVGTRMARARAKLRAFAQSSPELSE